MKKAITLILALALVLALGVPALAEYGYTVVIPLQYYGVGDFSEGLAPVAVGENRLDQELQWGFIDETGAQVIPLQYKDARSFSEGLAAVAVGDHPNQKWGFIDKTGAEVVPCRYEEANNFSEGLAAVKWNGKWGYIDKTDAEVIPCKYDDVYEGVRNFSEGLVAVQLSGKWGFIDKTGAGVLPAKYEGAQSFSEGLAAVQLSGKWGYINRTGAEVIPFEYSRVDDFSGGIALVRMTGAILLEKMIDKTGREVASFEGSLYNVIGDYSEAGRGGLVRVTKMYNPSGWYDPSGYIRFNIDIPTTTTKTAYASTQTVNLDGEDVEFQCYALKDENGNPTNYIKLRDLAALLNGSAAQFEVGWDGSVVITTHAPYTPAGGEGATPFSGDREYQDTDAVTKVDGQTNALTAFMLTDDAGGGYTYYKLRDLGEALGFNVGWSAGRGIFVETDKPYNPAD